MPTVVNASSIAPRLSGPFTADAIEFAEDVGNALQFMVTDGVTAGQAIQAAADAGLPVYWRAAAYILAAESTRRPATLATIKADTEKYGDKLGTLVAGIYQGSRPAFGDDTQGVQKALTGLIAQTPDKIVAGYVAAILNNAGPDNLKSITVDPSGQKPTPPLAGLSGGIAMLIGMGVLVTAVGVGLYVASRKS